MNKHLLSSAAALFFITSVAAVIPRVDKETPQSALSESMKATPKVEMTKVADSSSEFPDPLLEKKKAGAFVETSYESLQFVDAVAALGVDSVIGKAVAGDATKIQPMRKRKVNAAAPQLVTGTLLSKDVNFKNIISSYRLTLDETNYPDSVSLTNLYGLGAKVMMYVNKETGRVSIPRQKVYDHSSYGEVSVCPIEITDEGKFIMLKGDIEGTLSSTGDITLGTWGVVVTQMDDVDGTPTPGANYGALFNVFGTSILGVPNTTVSCYSILANKLSMYEMRLEQTESNEIMLYGLSNLTSNDVLAARLTSDKRMIVSPQVIYTNMFYGPFCNYAASFTYDSTSEKWGVSVDWRTEMQLKGDGEGGFELPGWVISAKAAPSQYIGYAFNEVQLETELAIEYPVRMPLDMQGKGTKEEPYKVMSVKDLQAMSQACEAGESLAGLYFELGNDLDFTGVSATAYVPVGTSTTPFEGAFDGKGHKISNFKADGKGFNYTGLFGSVGESASISNLAMEKCSVTAIGTNVGLVAASCAGKISGITVVSSSVDCDGELGGGIVGALTKGGSITDCSFSGSITSAGSGAGIAAQVMDAAVARCSARVNVTLDGASSSMANKECAGIVGTGIRATVEDCYVSGTLTDALGYGYIGGVAGYLTQSSLARSFNTAAISAKRAVLGSATSTTDGDTHTGGLVGYISGTEVTDCYNSGTIIKSDRSENVGGLVGYLGVGYSSTSGRPMEMINVSHITNCYNSGQIISTSSNTKKGIFGGVFVSSSYSGPNAEEICFKNCYFDSQILGMDNETYGLPTRSFTAALPAGFSQDVWKQQAGMYPVLATTGTGTQAQELSAYPLTLRVNDNSGKVKVEFEVTSSANVNWTLSHNAEAGETETETSALKLDGNKIIVKDQYANAVVNATTADNWGIKLYRLSIVPKLFDGEGTADDPYLLKEIKDYQNLDEAVAKYGQTHKGDFFAMANDIDFKGGDEFHGVGFKTANEFHGSFDGKGHKVSGLKIDAGVYDDKGSAQNNSYIYSGLFGIIGVNGSVRNVIIADDCDFTFYSYGGAIAGLSSGIIENCRNYATVNGISNYIGGIAGVNYDNGKVLKCYNAGTVNFGVSNAGGIAGYNRATGLIELCQNDGDVVNKVVNVVSVKTKSNTAGGIVGYNYGSVSRTVNNGQVRAYHTAGGIAGITNIYSGEGNISNSVNNALVNNIDETLYRGGVIGELKGNCQLTNNYYDASINVNGAASNNGVPGVKGLYSSEMLSGTAFEGLDAADFDIAADSYPVLKLFADEAASKALRSIYVGFAPKMLRTNVLEETPLSKAEGVKYGLEKGESFGIKDGFLTVVKPEGMTVATDSLTASIGDKYIKSYRINSVPVILKGEGTAESPYLIETSADWNKLADFMASSNWEYSGNVFRIENDLDFKGDSIRLAAVNGVNFQATLDGNGRTIKNYVYTNKNSIKTKLEGPNLYVGKYLGLIGTLGSGGIVKNLTIDGVLQGHSYLGSIVGENYGRIENVKNLGKVETLTDSYAAGIASRSYTGSSIVNCVNEGPVISKKTYATGLVYESKVGSLIENCTNKGELTSTTTGTFGLAYKVAGTIKGCSNEGKMMATGTMVGLVHTLDVTAHMEDCVNYADLDLSGLAKPGGSLFGIANTLTAVKTPDPESDGAQMINCHNYGNIKGASYLYGGFKTVGAGWTIQNCSNTGNIEGTGYAAGLAGDIGGGKSEDLLTVVKGCFNTGNVSANGTKVAGLAEQLKNFALMEDCYNLGNVTTANSGLTSAGLVAQCNGVMERCFNAGDVLSAGNAVGGIFGYMAAGDVKYPAAVRNSFNIGDVTTTYTGTNTNGHAGGLGGYLSTCNDDAPHVVENCYNTGNVTASKRVAGLFAGAFRPSSIVKNCYNSGKITCLDADDSGRYYWSGTTFTNNYEYTSNGVTQKMLAGHENCFYDATVNPGKEFRSVPGSAKTTEELRNLQISEAFVLPEHGGYPILKDFAEADAAHAGSALILLSAKENEAHDNVTSEITLVAPAGAEWTASDIKDEAAPAAEAEGTSACLKIEDGKAVPAASGKVLLTCTYKGMSKNYELNVNYTGTSGVDESFAGKEIKSTQLIDLQGRTVVEPEAGVVYIVKTVYTDGTMKIEKKIAVK